MRRRLAALACATMLASTGSAAAAERTIDLPAGDLGAAVRALSQQIGLSVGVESSALTRLQTPPLRGRMNANEAFSALLSGLPVRAVPVGDGAWRIVSAPAQTRPRKVAARSLTPRRPPPPQPIVVTASKRDLTLTDFAGSVTVLDANGTGVTLPALGTADIVRRLATLNSTHGGPGRNKLFIRGIADSSFLGPTQATVGQYLGDTRLNYNAPDPDLRLYDVGRVEVLEGPQGTLYGAGSLGGVLRAVPNAPELDRLSGSVSAGGAVTAHGDPSADFSGMLDVPLVESQAGLRVVGYGGVDGGYIDDTLRGLDDVNRVTTYGGRAALRILPAENWTLDIGAAVQTVDARDSQFADRDAPPLTRASAIAQGYSSDFLLADLKLSGEWDDIRFVSSTGVVRQDRDETFDATPLDGTPTAFSQNSEVLLVSTENRIARDLAQGYGLLVGASLLHNEVSTERDFGPARTMVASTGLDSKVDEATLFGEASFELAKRIVVTAGGRVSYTWLSGGGVDVPAQLSSLSTSASRGETAFLPSLSALYRASDGMEFFVRYQQGFRPGGLAVRDAFVQRFRNDRVETIEAGLRLRRQAFDLAATIAHTDWNDIQADIVDMNGFPATANIGDGRIESFDLKANWRPVDGLTLGGSLFVNDSKVTEPVQDFVFAKAVAAQNDLPNVPGFGVQGSARYRASFNGGWQFETGAQGRYVGTSRLGVRPLFDAPQGDYAEVDLDMRIGRGGRGVSLTVFNLFDVAGNRFSVGTPFTLGARPQITPLRPRTIRIGFDAEF
ncbi:TonB-dependent receptor [Pacificimonas flava]|uniref:TonB-dependent receptor n=1 Tax=Pacificimonas flava TaxID=1234595 RepID=M2T7P0_9SPHN|nr:TonB-dependent receptor [Pacificimonas flava]EMD82544.1 TonB-dependent receptor [Pacificimonas flava]MBB5281374.1 outer membrane receptor protein involved in Fe transport [Pacificimonas flava]